MGNRASLILIGGLVAAAFAAAPSRAPSNAGQDGEPRDDRPPHERIDVPAVAACGGCHQGVYEEWSETLHARAWTNRNVQSTHDFKTTGCRHCHSPQPVLISGLDRMPDYRDTNQEDGVHCLSCHGLADGVAAARTIEGAPCRPRFEPRLVSTGHCWPCHEPTHQAYEEYRTSDAFALGVRCVDCHMQPRTSGERQGGRYHGPTGGMNPEFVRRALAWTCRIADGHVELELRNRAAHKFPGEIPSRAFLVRVAFDAGEPERLLLRKPFRGEDRADDRLLPDERRIVRFPLPEGARRADVRLVFLPLPLMPEEQGFTLGEWSGSTDD